MTITNEFNQSASGCLISFRRLKRNYKYICGAFFFCWFLTNAAADNLHLRNIIADSSVVAVDSFGSPLNLSPGEEVAPHVFSHGDVDKVDFYKGSKTPSNFICELTVKENEYVWNFGMSENYQPQVYLPAEGVTPCVYWSSFPQREWSLPIVSTNPMRQPGPDFSYVIIYSAPFKR